ncbi:MAG TPA: cytochrome C oxidase subunit IV family protein [Candidatus Bathyarchaeia archaeon]|nr:cytochrome C oxidase subunit IV family protein [Candidatus Bathyarchaeia archaeon]
MAGVKLYVGIWLALVAATIIEVVASSLPGSSSLIVTIIMLVASAKAIVIALYYQHLRYEGIRVAVMPLAAIVALGILAVTAIVSLGM